MEDSNAEGSVSQTNPCFGHGVLLHSRNRKTALLLVFLSQSFSSKLQLIDSVGLAGRRASGNECLALPSAALELQAHAAVPASPVLEMSGGLCGCVAGTQWIEPSPEDHFCFLN